MDRKLIRRFVWLLYGAYIIGILLLPEIGARVIAKLTYTPPAKSRYLEISDRYPLLRQLISDWNALRFTYHDYYVYSPAPASSQTVNFTEYFGARLTPDSASHESVKQVVWAFGGSTMQNLEADDRLTLANQIAVELNKANAGVSVYNFGAGGFQSSLEAIKFQDLLRRVPASQRPTTAIFYDGFNEAMYGYYFGAGAMQADLSMKMRDLVERRYPRLITYAVSELLSRYSVFWRDYIDQRISNTLYGNQEFPHKRNMERTVSTYVLNVRMTAAICKNLGIRCLFLLQPLVATRSNPTEFEQGVLKSLDPEYIAFTRELYEKASEQLAKVEGFVDLSRVFDHDADSHFFDLGHTEPYAGIIVGKEIARLIAEGQF
ncbi:MAG TPA: hypothetical protein VJ805_03620 [Nitrospiraceae bacterium]|nr:hypothetical protein [Nitrospiraceae bacterium]